jgi:hypothetical protein
MALRALQGPTGGGSPVGGAGTLDTIALWTPDGNTLGNSLLTQAGNVTTNSGTFRTADGSNTEPGYTFSNSSGSGMYRGTSGTVLRFASSGTFAFGVSSTGNVLIGGTATTTPGGRLDVVGVAGSSWAIRAQVSSANTLPALNAELGLNLKNTSATVGNYTSITNRDSSDNANTQINFINVNNSGSGAINFVTRDSVGGSGERARIDSAGNFILNSATTNAVIQASGTGQGLKLPATPGNADTQTLDAYQEMGSGAYVASTATLTCGTSGTITLKTTSDQNKLYVTRIGRTVHVSGFLVVDSVSSPTGRLTITTSPALPAVQNGAGANIVFTGPTGLVAGDLIQPTISASTIFCDVYNGGVQSQTGAAKMQANTSLWVSFSYHAA